MGRSPASSEVVAQVERLIPNPEGFAFRAESNSELCNAVDLGSEGRWVSYRSERETTQSKVKAPNS